MTDEELKQQIIDKHLSIFPFNNKGSVISHKIIQCMEEWAGIISKRTEDSLLEELGFGDDPDRFSNSLDDVFKDEL
jgi:hypothetical protein